MRLDKDKLNSDGTYTYSESLHKCVGALVQSDKVKTQQLSDLTKAISLKDLSIKASDDKATLWSNTSSKLEGQDYRKTRSASKMYIRIFFAFGVLALALLPIRQQN